LGSVLPETGVRCQIFHLKCTKFNLRLGLCPRPDPSGDLTAFPRPPSWIWGKETGKEKGRWERGRENEEGER